VVGFRTLRLRFCVFAFDGRGLGPGDLGSRFRISRFRIRVFDFAFRVRMSCDWISNFAFSISRLTGGVWVLAASRLDFELRVLEFAFSILNSAFQ
jgi:hypothetical protein